MTESYQALRQKMRFNVDKTPVSVIESKWKDGPEDYNHSETRTRSEQLPGGLVRVEEGKLMDQVELTSIFTARPKNFAWFLGAGASRSAGLPTATDIIWDLKRRYFCREENQDVSQQDIQNEAVRKKIQAFVESKGFPAQWANNEYSMYFEKFFGDDKEQQRRYLSDILSEDRVALSVGHRVLGAFLASQFSRVVFTTNFDSVVEKAVAELSGQSIAAYHLEGSHVAKQALNNEEYPIYCKLHGDFHYDNLKNLPDDLAIQNEGLSECLVNAGNRFGFIVVGYSGRDQSIMVLLRSVLDSGNPFPHGLFWAGIKGSPVLPAVEELLKGARDKGVNAQYVPIETFDTLMLRLWRNTPNKPSEMDARVRKSRLASVSIPLPPTGRAGPILRLNALPILSLPRQCLKLTFSSPKDWSDLRQARNDAEGRLILTKSDTVFCWGNRDQIRDSFGKEISSIDPHELPTDIGAAENLYIKGFLEEALCTALAQGKQLLPRVTRFGAFLIADRHAEVQGDLQPLSDIVGKPFGEIPGLVTQPTEKYPRSEKVSWAEAVRISLDIKSGRHWLQLEPDIWVWPPHGRKVAVGFLDKRRSDRYNKQYNALLDAWVRIVLGTEERNVEITVSAFNEGDEPENPAFRIGTRTAYTWRLTS